MINPTHQQVYSYFRMGIATGIVAKEDVIAWADAELLRQPEPSPGLIELSLSGQLPYSQLLHILNALQLAPDYDLPLNLLLSPAGLLLEADPSQAPRLVTCLSLLLPEEYLSKVIKAQITILAEEVQLLEPGGLDLKELQKQLKRFLKPYRKYQSTVRQLLQMDGQAPA